MTPEELAVKYFPDVVSCSPEERRIYHQMDREKCANAIREALGNIRHELSQCDDVVLSDDPVESVSNIRVALDTTRARLSSLERQIGSHIYGQAAEDE